MASDTSSLQAEGLPANCHFFSHRRRSRRCTPQSCSTSSRVEPYCPTDIRSSAHSHPESSAVLDTLPLPHLQSRTSAVHLDSSAAMSSPGNPCLSPPSTRHAHLPKLHQSHRSYPALQTAMPAYADSASHSPHTSSSSHRHSLRACRSASDLQIPDRKSGSP